jgi:hypothetical protein
MNPLADRYYFIIHQRKGSRLYSEVRDISTNQVVFSDTRFEDKWCSDDLTEMFEQKLEEVIF